MMFIGWRISRWWVRWRKFSRDLELCVDARWNVIRCVAGWFPHLVDIVHRSGNIFPIRQLNRPFTNSQSPQAVFRNKSLLHCMTRPSSLTLHVRASSIRIPTPDIDPTILAEMECGTLKRGVAISSDGERES